MKSGKPSQLWKQLGTHEIGCLHLSAFQAFPWWDYSTMRRYTGAPWTHSWLRILYQKKARGKALKQGLSCRWQTWGHTLQEFYLYCSIGGPLPQGISRAVLLIFSPSIPIILQHLYSSSFSHNFCIYCLLIHTKLVQIVWSKIFDLIQYLLHPVISW